MRENKTFVEELEVRELEVRRKFEVRDWNVATTDADVVFWLSDEPFNAILKKDASLFTYQKGKQFYFDIQVSNLLENYSVNGLVLKLHDITAKKQKEQTLILANQQQAD